MQITVESAWDYLLESGTCTEGELHLATCLIGYSLDTLEQVLDVKTGYKAFSQLDDFETEEDSEESDDESEE